MNEQMSLAKFLIRVVLVTNQIKIYVETIIKLMKVENGIETLDPKLWLHCFCNRRIKGHCYNEDKRSFSLT